MKEEKSLIEIDVNTYKILINENIFYNAPKYLEKYQADKELFLVTDDKVYGIYNKLINNVFTDYKLNIVVIKNGEVSKNLKTFETVVDELLDKGIKKYHTLVAFGGGVVGDLTGFIASTLFRGINYIQIPTTLLSQVDSSIGAKTGIDSKFGKNLIGSFYHPKVVLIDPELLKSLSKEDYNNGMAEIIKAGLIHNKKLYDLTKVNHDIKELIKEAILVKKHFITIDPFDKKERRILNFGHTYGHALEAALNYEHILHGQAISIGMLKAIQLGINVNVTNPHIYEDVLNTLQKYELIINHPLVETNDIMDKIKFDKKYEADGIDFILIEEIGKPAIKRIKVGDLYDL